MIGKEKRSGFALVAAVLVTFVLMAAGILVFTLTTRDHRVSIKVLSGRQALSSAESGVHNLMTTFDPARPSASLANDQQISGEIARYTFTISQPVDSGGHTKPITSGYGPDLRPIPGDEVNQSGQAFFSVRYSFDVTGNDTVSGSSVQLNIGVGYGPVQINQ
jgi:hypothetical protein